MICVGLGNPGNEYERTRHNVGFMVLDRLATQLSCMDWKKEKHVVVTKHGPHTFVKPGTYMNESGPALREWLAYRQLLEIDGHELIIVHDDLDFPLGEVRDQFDRSAGGHNGVQSIIEALGTQAFRRIRIGIGNNREVGTPAEAYVLQRFSPQEVPIIKEAIEQAVKKLEAMLVSQ